MVNELHLMYKFMLRLLAFLSATAALLAFRHPKGFCRKHTEIYDSVIE